LRILIHNSDSPKNRGDRAILVGLIELVRRRWPDAEIWSLSQFDERDSEWFGIRFLRQSPYSTRLGEWIALLRFARSADIILWGGGEIMKDYTNRLGLVYWWVKLTALSLVNRNIVGAFQGIGPTSAASSKRVIRRTVGRTRAFITRDEESKTKLLDWGTRTPIVASFDPAVMGTPSVFDAQLEARLVETSNIDAAFLRGSIGFGLRRWFHYKQAGFLPAKYRRGYDGGADSDSPELTTYRARVAELADRLVERHDAGIVFFPMHMDASEGDAEFAESVIALMKHGDRTRILASDTFSSNDYAGVMSQVRFFVASRLHSAILATMANVPSFVLYYVDKGRLYFEQIGMQRYSAPIASILETGAVDSLVDSLDRLVAEADDVRSELRAALATMTTELESGFADGLAAARLS
jgi:polysaccharide pyruvyl transferase WcaK-like protein